MSDARLQKLERSWKAGNVGDDEYLAGRLRLGGLSRNQLELLSYLGHPAACRVVGDGMWWDGLDLWDVLFDDYNQWDGCIGLAGPFVLDPIYQWSPEAWAQAIELAAEAVPEAGLEGFDASAYSTAPREKIWSTAARTYEAWSPEVRDALLPWVFEQRELRAPTAFTAIEPGGWGRPLEGDPTPPKLAKKLASAKLKVGARVDVAGYLGHPRAIAKAKSKPPRDDLAWAQGLAGLGGEVCARASLAIAWEVHAKWHKVMRRTAKRPTACLILTEALLADPENQELREAGARAAVRPDLQAEAEKLSLSPSEPPHAHLQRWRARFAERTARWAVEAAADPARAGEVVVRPFEQAAALAERWDFALVRTSRLRAAVVRQVLPWALGLSPPEPTARKKLVTKKLLAETIGSAGKATKKKATKKKATKKKATKKKATKKKATKKKATKKNR